MSSRRKRNLESELEMDMTPMIDIVFLLIAFFMIVSDLSKLDIQEVILPIATEAIPPKPQPGERELKINVVLVDKTSFPVKAEVRLGGNEFGYTAKELAQSLKAEVEEYGKMNKEGKSELKILVRCDEGAPAGAIHLIYKACQEVKIYKVSLAGLSEKSGQRYKASSKK